MHELYLWIVLAIPDSVTAIIIVGTMMASQFLRDRGEKDKHAPLLDSSIDSSEVPLAYNDL